MQQLWVSLGGMSHRCTLRSVLHESPVVQQHSADQAATLLPAGSPPSGSPAQQTTLFGAAANTAGFEAAIHTAVHRLGRHLGFQAFNVLPTSEVRAALFT